MEAHHNKAFESRKKRRKNIATEHAFYFHKKPNTVNILNKEGMFI